MPDPAGAGAVIRSQGDEKNLICEYFSSSSLLRKPSIMCLSTLLDYESSLFLGFDLPTQPGQSYSALTAPTGPKKPLLVALGIRTVECPLPAGKNIPSSVNKKTDHSKAFSGATLKRKHVVNMKSEKSKTKEHFPESKFQNTRSSSNNSPVRARDNRSSSREIVEWKIPKTKNTVEGLEKREKRESRRSPSEKRTRRHDTPERKEHSPRRGSSKDKKYAEDERISDRERRARRLHSSDRRRYTEDHSSPDNKRISPLSRKNDSRRDWDSPPNKVCNISAQREDKQYSSSYGKDYTESQRSSGKESHSGGRSLPVVGQRDTQYTQNDEINEAEWRQIPSKSFIGDQSSGMTTHSAGQKTPKGRDDDAGRGNTSYSVDLIKSALVRISSLLYIINDYVLQYSRYVSFILR